MKKFLSLIFALAMIAVMCVGCRPDNKDNKDMKQETEFYDIVMETQELLDVVGDDIYSYWYDCIYKDKYYESIDLAIASAIADNKDSIDQIEANNDTIKTLYKEVKDGELQDQVKAVMQAYNDYYSLVMEVSGSFKSYSSNKETLKKTLSSALKNLEIEL